MELTLVTGSAQRLMGTLTFPPMWFARMVQHTFLLVSSMAPPAPASGTSPLRTSAHQQLLAPTQLRVLPHVLQ